MLTRLRHRINGLPKIADEWAARKLVMPLGRVPRHDLDSWLIVAPSREGNIGDEAMLQSVATHLKSRGARHVGLLVFSNIPEWDKLSDIDSIEMLPDGLEHIGLAAKGQLRRIAARYSHAVVIGADVLDGYYSREKSLRRLTLTRILLSSGLAVTIAGFSINHSPDRACLRTLLNLSKNATLCLRDKLSYDRLPVDPCRKKMVADAAFMLHAKCTNEIERDLFRSLELRRESGIEVLACNINAHAFPNKDRQKLELLTDKVALALNQIKEYQANIHLLLVPHDSRHTDDDSVLLGALKDKLGRHYTNEVTLLPSGLSASGTKAIAGLCSAALSGRMHFAIACLGMGVPVLGLSYQDKFEGTFEHLGMSAWVLSPELAITSPCLQTQLSALWIQRGELRRLIQQSMDRVVQLSSTIKTEVHQ